MFATCADAVTIFSFTLSRPGHTSAGVYNGAGKLVRTLWCDVLFISTGSFSQEWDGLDDFGLPVPGGTYTIKVLAHNVNYVWQGVVGNTSDNSSGATVHANIGFVSTLSFSGNTGCYAVGYSERCPAFLSFSTAAPQQVTARFTGAANMGNYLNWLYSDADSSKVYFACLATEDPVNPTSGVFPNRGAVSAFNPVTGAPVNFTNGSAITAQAFGFSNGVYVGTQPSITGLAVQKLPGNTLLAVSVAADNKVYLLDKVSGSIVRSFTVASPKALAFDNSDTLWVTSGTSILHYDNLNATPTLTGTISGLAAPLALAVSPASAAQPNLLLVGDGGGSHQIKAYNMSGVLQWTFGKAISGANGYSADPTVTNDKFWFYRQDILNWADCCMEHTSIAFEPNGSFWVLDAMNARVMHYQLGVTPGALPIYQNQISFLDDFYVVAVDQNNPSRVFASMHGKWLEYSVNSDRTLAGTNGSWTLVKNWGYGLGTNFKNNTFEGFTGVATLSNGRTYAVAYDYSTTPRTRAIFELPATGNLRLTSCPQTTSAAIYADGSLRSQTLASSVSTITKKPLTGFDASGDPLWGAPVTLAKVPGVVGTNPAYGANAGGPRLPMTLSNKVVFFDNSYKRAGMHLGGIDLGASTTWAWEASPGIGASSPVDLQIPLWGDGSYDAFQDIQHPGGGVDASGRSVVYVYTGQFWAGMGAQQLMHFYDDGLFIGQFGTPGSAAASPTVIPPGAAGNPQMPAMTVFNGKTYLYVTDENQHGGIHRWRLDGLDTVAELSGSGMLNTTITLTGSAPVGTAPSLSGVPSRVAQVTATPTNGAVFLQWAPTSNSTYYQVRRSTLPNNAFQIIATGLFQNCLTDFDVTNGTTYYYVVTAVNGGGAGVASQETIATPSTSGNVYEAESGTLVSTVPTSPLTITKDSNASGNRTVNNKPGTITINNVNGGVGGVFTLVIRYAGQSRTSTWFAGLTVNATPVPLPGPEPKFPWTGSNAMDTATDYRINIPLNAGTGNTIVLSNPPFVDKFTVLIDTPLSGVPVSIPATGSAQIEMENYDYGGEGVAFHDTTTATVNSIYRPQDGVGIGNLSTASNGFFVNHCAAGEWLKYTVSVPSSGPYMFSIVAGTPLTGKMLHLEDELGNNLTGTIVVTNTGDYNIFAANNKTVNLTAGTHNLKVVIDNGGYNLDYFTLEH